ncbi:MAG: hypothetical protein MZV70_41215 [Desulfobacterales bacterium]|nr:hypothetical protein [Desulfobacterales bacterium]
MEKKIPTAINKSGTPKRCFEMVEGFDFGGLYAYKKKFCAGFRLIR